MCGIFGGINGKKARLTDTRISSYMRDALVANSLRGMDSTGIFQMRRGGASYYHKRAVAGSDFINDPAVAPFLFNADDSRFTVGHNRAATKGAISDLNAHPFQHLRDNGDWLIGVHNGTLQGWEADADAKDFKVDSDWALARLTYDGDDAFKKINGPSAFVWYDSADGDHLNIYRNSGRPMFVAYLKTCDRMLFGSEYMMMEWLAQRNGLALENDIIELAPGWKYQFNIDAPKNFRKKYMPAAAAQVTTTYYTRPADEVFFEKMEKIFADVRSVAGSPVAGPSSTLPVVDGPVTLDQPKIKATLVVTPEEQRLARAGGVIGLDVTFFPEFYDDKTNEFYGTVTTQNELYSAVIRRVDEVRYAELEKETWLSAKVIGATGIELVGNSGMKEMCLILGHRSVKAPANEEKKAQAKDDTTDADLAAAIKRSIDVHQSEKANVQQQALFD